MWRNPPEAAADVLGTQELLLGNMPGSLGEVAALALLAGFAYLLWRRVIRWHVPVTVLATMVWLHSLAVWPAPLPPTRVTRAA